MAQITDILEEYRLTSIDGVDKYGHTALHLTVINKKFTQKEINKVLKILLDGGVDPKIVNNKNETVLQVAVKNKMKDVVDFLLKNVTDNDLTAHFFVNEEYQKFSEFSSSIKLDIDIRSVETESASFVEWLLSREFDFVSKNVRNQSALYMAIELNLQHVLPILLKYTKDINLVDQRNRTLLHFFLECKANNYGINKNWYFKRYESEIVKILLDSGISVDAEDISSQTPIRIAIENQEDMSIIEILLERSSNIINKNYRGDTLFQMVIRKWNNSTEEKNGYYLELAQALVAKGADLNEPDKDGKRPLIYAIEKRKLHVIEFLKGNGADFRTTTKDGKPLINLVFESICMNTGDEIEMTIFKLLLEHATHIDQKNSEGDTLFHMLIWKWTCSSDAENDYYMKIACALIYKGADVDKPNEYGTRPLFHAVERYNLCIVKFLRDKGANFNLTTDYDETLLHILIKSHYDASSGDCEIKMKLFDFLIKRSTNIYHENFEGATPFGMVIGKWATSKQSHVDCYMRMAQALIAKVSVSTYEPYDYYGKTLPFNAIGKHNLGMVKFLEENGADFSMRTEDGESLMHLFAKSNDCWKTGDDGAEKKFFNLLLRKGCQVNVRDKNGTTPLHVAAMYSNLHVVQMLIEHGAQINCNNNQKETPLHFATRNPKFELVAGLLLKLGANVNAKDSKGQTPLHKIACGSRLEHSYIGSQLLLKHGADVNIRDLENRKALSYALSRDLDDLQWKCEAWVDIENESRRRRATNNRLPILVTINECPIQDMANDVVIGLTKHSIALKAVNLLWDQTINDSIGHFVRVNVTKADCKLYHKQCLKEVEILKSTFIDNHTSLYDFLHMDLNRKSGYVNNEKLKKLLRSPLKLKLHMFPIYADLIFASQHEAITRKVLLEPARKIWLELTKISLPADCLDLILSFLNNADLHSMLEN